MSGKGAVQLSNVVLSYGNERVVHGISLDIAPGEFVCLLGPSGCGKTTTLRAIAGLAAVDSGAISIDGTVANAKPAHERGKRFVEQQHGRIDDEAARKRNALLLATGKLPRQAPLEA